MNDWRDLFVTDHLAEAGLLATSLAAMEFDVRLRDQASGRILDAEMLASCAGPFIVDVRTEDWPDLVELRDEILDEQRRFDEELSARERWGRVVGWTLLATTLLGGLGMLMARRLW